MIREIPLQKKRELADYSALAHLAGAVAELEREARQLAPRLADRTVWMVNSSAEGGGVAEMMPRLCGMLNELGVATRWVVIGTDRKEFFPFTKNIHNLIHGAGEQPISGENRELYDQVSRELAAELGPKLAPGDVLVTHDPQPAGLGAILARDHEIHTIWRCHIGLDEDTPETRAAWSFLEPHVRAYDHAVFTAAAYIPEYLHGNVSIITPGLDPLSHKNRELSTHKLVGILACAELIEEPGPMLAEPFSKVAQRLQADGSFEPADRPSDFGLLYRPIVTQVSRWDRLKGWRPLIEGFVKLRSEVAERAAHHRGREKRALELVRLVLAGPEPSAIADDPEATEVFRDLCDLWLKLPAEIQEDIGIFSLPMDSRKNNALMVNALQRCSTVVVQNSLREGFGLTVTEPMWKRVAVLGSSASGIRLQIRDGIDGVLLADPEDREALADALEALLSNPQRRELLARSAQRRAHDEFLVFTQLRRWLRLLAQCVAPPSSRGRRAIT